mmetsp:Transcript_16446/g.42447  ORF Transcript_16446/g.42447 Transcript_16446/m.42447 type:complete len:87 (-) Transcript_16446:92-352(-)
MCVWCSSWCLGSFRILSRPLLERSLRATWRRGLETSALLEGQVIQMIKERGEKPLALVTRVTTSSQPNIQCAPTSVLESLLEVQSR